MKLPILITLFIGVVVSLAGCKGDSHQATSESVPEELVLNVMELDYESMESAIQVGWLMGRLETCLSELEKKVGLEPMPFDWVEAKGFPKIKQDPNKVQCDTPKQQPFYIPYPTVKKSEINVERYTEPEHLSIYIEKQLSARKTHMLGMDKYIKHLDQRLKRLEDHLKK